jgi:hypothetical protein
MTSSVPRPSVFEAERVWKKARVERTLLSVAFDFSISILSWTSILPTLHPQPTRVKALSVPRKASNEDRGLSPHKREPKVLGLKREDLRISA